MNGQLSTEEEEEKRGRERSLLPFLDANLSNGDLYHWKSVTEEFMEACKDLELGELLHDDIFGLFEAMSAIELMDPKMDAGMICNRNATKPLNFQTALESGHLKLENVSGPDQIGIIDVTFSCLVTWLEGHSLAQTVFTNLYLHETSEVQDPLMKAFTIVILKFIDLVKDFIARGGVYEEEDFQPLVYGFKLFNELSETRACGMLREVEDELQRTLRNTRSKHGEQRDQKTLREHEEAGALFSRIRLLRLLYLGLVHLYKNEVAEGQKYLKAANDQISNILATIRLGTHPEEGRNMVGFEPLVNQRLLPPTFPRYTEIKGRREAAIYIQGLLQRLILATSISHFTSFHATLDFFIDFGSSSDSCVLSRSVLQTLYQPLQNFNVVGASGVSGISSVGITAGSGGSNRLSRTSSSGGGGGGSGVGSPPSTFQDLLRESCRSFINPPSLSSKNPPFTSQQIKDCLYSFFSQCCRPMGLFLQTFGHNRARQRDKIATLLEEFASVQEEADKLDTMLNAVANQSYMLFYSTWLLYHVLRLMVRYLLSGFELELYSVHEFPYFYWYLFELIYPWLTTCLHRADAYLIKQEQFQESQRVAGKNKKKVKNVASKRKTRPYAREITYYQGYAILCAGYFKLLVGLRKEGKTLIPNCEFDNGNVRYEHRFAPFANLLTPPLMPYSQYIEVYDHLAKSESSEIFGAAAKDFAQARQMFESVISGGGGSSSNNHSSSSSTAQRQNEEFESLIAVTKNNFVVSSVLVKDVTRNVDFDFTLNNRFPTVKFV